MEKNRIITVYPQPEYIMKRDGKKVTFNREKIREAIRKASKACPKETVSTAELDGITDSVVGLLNPREIPTVEEIQDIVEKSLIVSNHPDIAKAYILYRANKGRIRNSKDNLMEIFNEITFTYSKEADLKRENANIDADSAMGMMLKYGSESSKFFVDNYILPAHIAKAHESGDIHIHDKDFYMLTETCCQIDLIKLFKGGFSTGHGYLREPNSITSYCALACIAIQANQNEMHGGQSVPNFDYAMAEGVKRTFKTEFKESVAIYTSAMGDRDINFVKNLIDDIDPYNNPDLGPLNFEPFRGVLGYNLNLSDETLDKIGQKVYTNAIRRTDRITYQAMEALIHNLNTMNSRAGAQVPFSSINYGTDTSTCGRIAIKNLLLATQAGLGNGETPIFPVQIFKVKEGINYNEGDANYDLFKLAMETSAKRLFPNFSFLDAPFNLQYYKEGDYNSEVSYMGCRTRVMGNHHNKEREITGGRGNLSFTSINLPRLGIKANSDTSLFYKLLDEKIELCIEQLLHRFKIQSKKKLKNYPFLMGQGIWIDSEKLSKDDEVGEILKHGTLSIGFIGLAETLKALTGNHHGESQKSQKLGLEITGHMRQKMDEASKIHGLNFTLIATPAEGLSGRFVALDKKLFGIIPGVTDRDYYTNSFHVPVYYPIKAMYKILLEAPYHALTNAGHISYIELDGNVSQNLTAFESVIRAMKESGIGYGSVNHPLDRDPVCGYNGVIGTSCPGCKRLESESKPFERIRRITGYLVGTTERFNNAKQKEEKDRIKHGL